METLYWPMFFRILLTAVPVRKWGRIHCFLSVITGRKYLTMQPRKTWLTLASDLFCESCTRTLRWSIDNLSYPYLESTSIFIVKYTMGVFDLFYVLNKDMEYKLILSSQYNPILPLSTIMPSTDKGTSCILVQVCVNWGENMIKKEGWGSGFPLLKVVIIAFLWSTRYFHPETPMS